MGQVIAFGRCEIEVSTEGMPNDALVEGAFAAIETFAEQLDAQLQREGVPYRRVKVRPVPSAELAAAIARPGAWRVEVEYQPQEAGCGAGREDA